MWTAKRNAAQATFTVLVFFLTTIIRAQPTIGYQPMISAGISSPIEVHTAPGDASGRLFIVEKGE